LLLLKQAHIVFITIASAQGLRPNCGNKIVRYFSVMTFLNGIMNSSLFFNFYSSYKKSKTI